jgi:hypothetical protein
VPPISAPSLFHGVQWDLNLGKLKYFQAGKFKVVLFLTVPRGNTLYLGNPHTGREYGLFFGP